MEHRAGSSYSHCAGWPDPLKGTFRHSFHLINKLWEHTQEGLDNLGSQKVLINLDQFLGKLYNGVLCLHSAPFSPPLPARLLSSLFLSVFLSSHLSFVPFFLHGDYNGIWQDIVTSSNLLSREQERKRWSREREGVGVGERNPQTHTVSTQTSSSEHLFSFISSFSHPLCPVLTWLACSEIDARVSSWKRTQSRHLIHGLHLSMRSTHRRDIRSFSLLTFMTRLRNEAWCVQLCRPVNTH